MPFFFRDALYNFEAICWGKHFILLIYYLHIIIYQVERVATDNYLIDNRIYPASELLSRIQNEGNRIVHTKVSMRRFYNLHSGGHNYRARNFEEAGLGGSGEQQDHTNDKRARFC